MESSIYDTMDLSWLLMGRYCRLYGEAKMGLRIWGLLRDRDATNGR